MNYVPKFVRTVIIEPETKPQSRMNEQSMNLAIMVPKRYNLNYLQRAGAFSLVLL